MLLGCVPKGCRTHPSPSINSSDCVAAARRGRRRLGSIAGLGLALVTGCGSSAPTAEGEFGSDCTSLWAPDTSLSIFTWWKTESNDDCQTHDGEGCAAQTLEQGYSACTPGAAAELVTKPSKDNTLTSVETPPAEPADGAIVNGGADVFRLARCQNPSETPKLASLGTLEAPAARFLVERTPTELRHLVTCPDGRLWGTVLGLHRLNQLFYNQSVMESEPVKAALRARGISFETTHDANGFLAVLEAVAKAGYEHPLRIPDDAGSWSRFLIENVMVAFGQPGLDGTAEYTHFWSRLSEGRQATDTTINLKLLGDTLDFARKVAKYIAPDSKAMASVTQGESAVFTVTGDWEVPNMGPELDVVPFPGTEHAYVYTADVAVATNKHGTFLDATSPIVGWFKAVTSTTVQSQFSPKKHSLSPVVFDGGTTRAKRAGELFTIGGQSLLGIAGLPSYVPHLSFDNLGPNTRDYMRCLIDGYAANGTAASESLCKEEQDALTQYVFEQYCWVLTGTTSGCLEVTSSGVVIK